MGFLSPTTLEDWRIHSPGACLTPFVALTGSLTLSAPCSPPDRPALFHAGNAHGVSPSELSPLEEPYRLSAAAALLTFAALPRGVLPIRPSTRNGANPAEHFQHLRDRARRTPSTRGRTLRTRCPESPCVSVTRAEARGRGRSRSRCAPPAAGAPLAPPAEAGCAARALAACRARRTAAPSPPELTPRLARADGPNTPLGQR
jgi:hypothetical protein